MGDFYYYADDTSLAVLSRTSQKIIAVGSDFGYGNFGDVLQHVNALNLIRSSGSFDTVSVMTAAAIAGQDFPSWAPGAYGTDAIVFVSPYPLILTGADPKLHLIAEIRNVAGVVLYGGGFLNRMWGEFVLSVVEDILRRGEGIGYWVSGQQVSETFEPRVIEHVANFRPQLFGVRDEMSARLLSDHGFAADFSFDDATEALLTLNDRLSVQRGTGLALHLNSSRYTTDSPVMEEISRQLSAVADEPGVNGDVVVLQAFRDAREEVVDAQETIKRLDYRFPFSEYRVVNLVSSILERRESSSRIELSADMGYSCSYHVTLWLQLAGIPVWLRSANSYYRQKASGLQVTQSFTEFLRSPTLVDHSVNLERRTSWVAKLQESLAGVAPASSQLQFEQNADAPSRWTFSYKGLPTLEQRLEDAEVASRAAGQRVVEVAELRERTVALSAQLTAVGHEAGVQRSRAERAEYEADVSRQALHETSAHLSAVLASRSWRLTRGLRVVARVFRGDLRGVIASARQRFGWLR